MEISEHLKRLRNSCMSAKISQHLAKEIEIYEPGSCRVTIPYNPNLTQNAGFLHGAAFFEIADTAGFIAANSLESTFSVLTLEFNINFFRSVKELSIYAEAKVLHRGKSIITCSSKVFNENAKFVAEGRGTYMISDILLSSLNNYR